MAEPTRLGDVVRGASLRFTWNGTPVDAYEGETVAAALLASNRRGLRETPLGAEPRGLFCAMGVCFDCLVTVDGRPGLRACVTPVRDGMTVAG